MPPIKLQPKALGGIGKASTHPFKIKFFTSEKTDSIKVMPGTVNQIIPSNIFDKIIVDTSDVVYVKLKVATNGKMIVSCAITVNNQPLDLASPRMQQNIAPSTFEVVLGLIDEGKVYQIIKDNISAIPSVAFKEGRTPLIPGGEPFVRWWQWNLNPTTQNQFYYYQE